MTTHCFQLSTYFILHPINLEIGLPHFHMVPLLIRNWLLLALSHDSTETAGVVQFYGPQQRPTALLEELSDPPGHQLAR